MRLTIPDSGLLVIQVQDGAPINFPLTYSNFRMLYPQTSFPDLPENSFLVDFGYAVFKYAERPAPIQFENTNDGPIVWVAATDAYTNTWINTPFTPAEAAAAFIKGKADFVRSVKAQAGAITSRVLGGLGSEYEVAEKEAAAYKAAGYPVTAIPSSVRDEIASNAAKRTPISAAAACDAILAAAAGWREAQSALRRNRLTAASAAEAAVDAPALDAVISQWTSFMATLTTRLGL